MITVTRLETVREIAKTAWAASGTQAPYPLPASLTIPELAWISGWIKGAEQGYIDGVIDPHANDVADIDDTLMQFMVIVGAQQLCCKKAIGKLAIGNHDAWPEVDDYLNGFKEAHSTMFESGMKERRRRDAEAIMPKCVKESARDEMTRQKVKHVTVAAGCIIIGAYLIWAIFQIHAAAEYDRQYEPIRQKYIYGTPEYHEALTSAGLPEESR